MSPIRLSVARCHERLDILIMGCESTNVRKKKNVTGNWNGSGKGPVVRSHYRANRVVPEKNTKQCNPHPTRRGGGVGAKISK